MKEEQKKQQLESGRSRSRSEDGTVLWLNRVMIEKCGNSLIEPLAQVRQHELSKRQAIEKKGAEKPQTMKDKMKWHQSGSIAAKRSLPSGRSLATVCACVALAVSLACWLPSAAANHAQSEVWSEADGLSLKYSTNHDDLLSTKGSELSLDSNKREQQQHAAGSAAGEAEEAPAGESGSSEDTSGAQTAAESGPEQAGGGGGVSSGAGDEEQSLGAGDSSGDGGAQEQGADSSSRQTNKLPVGGRVHSYDLSASSQRAHKQPTGGHSQVPRFRDLQQQATNEEDEAPPSAAAGARSKVHREEPADSYSSGPSDEAAPPPSSPGSSADEGTSGLEQASDSADAPPPGSYGSARFRQPGRLFKQAVRLPETPRGESNGGPSADDDDSASNEEGQSSAGGQSGADEETFGASQTPKHQLKPKQAAQFASETSGEPDENELSAGSPDDSDGGRRSVGTGAAFPSQPESGSGADEEEGAPSSNGFFDAFGGSSFGRGHSQGGFHDHSAARAPLASSNKERAVQQQSSGGHKQQQQEAKPAGLGAGGAKSGQSQKPLAYLRSALGEQARGAPRDQRPAEHRAAVKSGPSSFRIQQQAANEGPDSVRDDFISPGHYPGSMPHLTQAASEVRPEAQGGTSEQAKSRLPSEEPKLAESKTVPQEAPVEGEKQSSQRQELAGKQAHQLAEGRTGGQLRASASNETAAKQENELQASMAATSEAQTHSVTVTPEPAAQAQEQQIMAPTLLASTTTMAPMVPTTSSTTSTFAPTSLADLGAASQSSPSPTPAQPASSLKRFKFIKKNR